MGLIKKIVFGDPSFTESQEKKRKLFMYLVSGGVTTVVNFASFLIFDLLVTAKLNVSVFGYAFDLMTLINQIIAWVIAVLVAYLTNRIFVFRSSGSVIKELLSFAAARVVSFLVIELGIFSIMIAVCENGFNTPQDSTWFAIGSFAFTYLHLIKILNSVFVVIANYVMSKIFVFKKEDMK